MSIHTRTFRSWRVGTPVLISLGLGSRPVPAASAGPAARFGVRGRGALCRGRTGLVIVAALFAGMVLAPPIATMAAPTGEQGRSGLLVGDLTASADTCPGASTRYCTRLGDDTGVMLTTITDGPGCAVRFGIDWGDGSPVQQREVGVRQITTVPHLYPALGHYVITVTGTVVPPSDPRCNLVPGGWDRTIDVEVIPLVHITGVKLLDIDGRPLQFLSTDTHPYKAGFTEVHGQLTITGAEGDIIDSIWLEVSRGATTRSARPSTSLLAAIRDIPLGADGTLTVPSGLLFQLAAGDGAAFAADDVDESVQLHVKAVSRSFEIFRADAGSVPRLVRFLGTNRYGGRDEEMGGDDWVLPSVRALVRTVAGGVKFGDFSNMNGGRFLPHRGHRNGRHVDGKFPHYKPRDAITANRMIAHLNNPAYGPQIRRVWVTYNRPGFESELEVRPDPDPFWKAIKDVVLADGRRARAVIRPAEDHGGHFHWAFED